MFSTTGCDIGLTRYSPLKPYLLLRPFCNPNGKAREGGFNLLVTLLGVTFYSPSASYPPMVVEKIKGRYRRAKDKLLANEKINPQNRRLWAEFFTFQERKLKRTNNLMELDNAAYKTLYSYIIRFRNINKWFGNKAWADLTKEDIRKVYDDLEDGKILTQQGQPFKAREDYYSKIFKSKPFEMAGKAELAREVIQYLRPTRADTVRFILEHDFRELIEGCSQLSHKALLWVLFDYGENIEATLQLRKRDFERQTNKDTQEAEYLVRYRKDILKRSRTPRTLPNNFIDTVRLLDILLRDMDDDQLVWDFGSANARKLLRQATSKTGVKARPNGEPLSLKDLRSGMACDLLKKGWSRDEVNGRLGHKPSSDEIDRYINFLAIDQTKPKRKVQEFKLKEFQEKLEASQLREKLMAQRYDEVKGQVDNVSIMLAELLNQPENRLRAALKLLKERQ